MFPSHIKNILDKAILLTVMPYPCAVGNAADGTLFENALMLAGFNYNWQFGVIILLLLMLILAIYAAWHYRQLVLTRTTNLMEVNRTLKDEVEDRIQFEQKLETEQVIRSQFLDQLTRLIEMTNELSQEPTTDDLCRKAVILCRERLGFGRIAFWFFESGREAMVGSFGVDLQGNLRDERDVRIFDRESIEEMEEKWRSNRHWYEKSNDLLRDGHGRIVGEGKHLTAGLWDGNEIIGFVTIDDYLKTDMSSPHLGELLALLGVLFGSLYALKNTQQALVEARDQSEKASSAKTEFLAMMSHEIRTPMNAIMGFSQLLSLYQQDTKESEFTEKIMESSRHLLSLINEILDYTKLSSGMINLFPQPLSLRDEIDKTLELFEPEAKLKGLSLESSISSNIPEATMLDKTLIRQILSNLIQNAIKFTDRGFVRVLLENSPVPYSKRSVITLIVEDSGIGIQAESLDKVFDPFQQADNTITRKYGGTGLGLAIVKRLVETLKGSISCESEKDKGSRFIIKFQSRPAKTASISASDIKGESKGAKEEIVIKEKPLVEISDPEKVESDVLNIIVAENDTQNQLVILSILNHLGYDAKMTDDGREVIDELKKGHFDLVIMDVQMPRINGIEATEMIRHGKCGEQNRNIPIIGLTAFAGVDDEEKGLAAGMDVYLKKPVRMERLKSIIASFGTRKDHQSMA